jgi:2-keto-4-pentenoate hydratase/2-oxohepta-3-ene-1,7-dioic acid hydratase in catechol pathway
MKIARFRPRGWPLASARSGVVVASSPSDDDATILDLASALAWVLIEREGAGVRAAVDYATATMPSSTVALLGTWQRSRAQIEALLAEPPGDDDLTGIESPLGPVAWRRSDVALLAPVDRPPAIRDFFAFETHMRNALRNLGLEVPPAWYEAPSHYVTRSASVFGPDEQAVWPHYTEQLDFELEFGIVIGRRGKDVPVEDAWAHIAGFTIFNDLSCRDVQRREMGTHVGPAKTKGFDGGTGLGPYLVTGDEFARPFDVEMRAFVNGELWSKGQSGTIYWPVEELVAHAAAGETLLPGDVPGSGTVGTGAGIEIGRWIAPGDTIRLEIDGIGALESRVERAAAPGTIDKQDATSSPMAAPTYAEGTR